MFERAREGRLNELQRLIDKNRDRGQHAKEKAQSEGEVKPTGRGGVIQRLIQWLYEECQNLVMQKVPKNGANGQATQNEQKAVSQFIQVDSKG